VTFQLRLAIVTLAAFGMTTILASSAVAAMTVRLASGPRRSASMLFQLRLLPVVVSTIAMILAIVAFERFEPRAGEERTALALVACAIVAAAAIAAAARRTWRSYQTTRRALRQWFSTAQPLVLPGCKVPAFAIDAPFPVVAVVGLVRPRLVVARSVLDACSEPELRAIVAHEQAHLRRRDNARRALIAAAPDLLAWFGAGRRLAAIWQTAIEEAADDEAVRGGRHWRVHLAEALIRVARLAPSGGPPVSLPASALYRGEDLADRVRRLVDPAAEAAPRERASWVLPATLALLPISLLAVHSIHEWMEIAIAFLP
jgi:Zn-dependent protease with chaperone function